MTFQPAPDCAEVVLDFLMSGTPTANVLHFHKAGGYNPTTLGNLVNSIDNIVETQYVGDFTLTQSYVGIRGKGLAVQNDIQFATSDGAFVGAEVAQAMPNSVSLCLTLRTDSIGRGARGRFYCQPPNLGAMATPNTVLTAYATHMVAALTAFRASASSEGWVMVVLSRYANKQPRATAAVFPVVTVEARNTRVDSQRGRMPTPV